MDGVASALVFALLHSLWQCALLAGAAALVLRALHRASAAVRHNVAMLFLVAMLLATGAQFIVFSQAEAPLNGLLPALLDQQLAALGLNASLLTTLVSLLWLVGALTILARQAAGVRAVAIMERAAYDNLEPVWRARVDALSATLRIAGTVAVRVSSSVITPCVTHLLRPIIWLPASLLTRTPPEQLEALLAHELAHIARKDWLWNSLQRCIEAALFYHPAVWWLSRRIRQEREHACDDLAVAACGDAVALAEALATLECTRRPAPSLAAAGGSLLQRVTRLLSDAPTRKRWSAPAILGALTIFGALLITQVNIGGGRLPDLQVTASTSGALGPGDFREITANENGTVRSYRMSVDAEGRISETYRVNGRVRPIDDDVRAWVARIMQQDLGA